VVAELFGATADGVYAHVRSLGLDPAFVAADVDRWLEDAASRVVARVGLPTTWSWADPDQHLLAIGRASIHFGAASLLYDANYPERALTTEATTNYGSVLWNRHMQYLYELVEALNAALRAPGGNAGDDPAAGEEAGTLRLAGPTAKSGPPVRTVRAGWVA
jgi:hypothetical protein